MKLLHEVRKARGFSACVAATYSIQLGWFERLLVRQLRLRGTRHITVFADQARLSEVIGAEFEFLRSAGRVYSVVGLDARVSFHPKLVLLAGPDQARLYIGSNNLTSAGFGGSRRTMARCTKS